MIIYILISNFVILIIKMGACTATSQPNSQAQPPQNSGQIQPQAQSDDKLITMTEIYEFKDSDGAYKITFEPADKSIKMECKDKDGTSTNNGRYEHVGGKNYKIIDKDGDVMENISIAKNEFVFKGNHFTQLV